MTLRGTWYHLKCSWVMTYGKMEPHERHNWDISLGSSIASWAPWVAWLCSSKLPGNVYTILFSRDQRLCDSNQKLRLYSVDSGEPREFYDRNLHVQGCEWCSEEHRWDAGGSRGTSVVKDAGPWGQCWNTCLAFLVLWKWSVAWA